MLVREMIKLGESQLSSAHCTDAKIDAEALYCHLTKADRVQLFLQANNEVEEAVVEQYFHLIKERAKRVPLQHITGVQEFMGLPFEVNADVLIPRQDTELLVEEAAKIIRGDNRLARERKTWRVLDLCCGSGAIGISLAKICPNTKVTATDFSPAALATAKRNADKNRIKVKFLQGDLFEPVGRKKFDLIASNPPYVRTNMIPVLQDEIKVFEPMLALDGGKDGLDFYRRIVSQASAHLKKQGVLILEIGHDQAEDVTQLIKETGHFKKAYVVKDLPGNNRVIYTSTLY